MALLGHLIMLTQVQIDVLSLFRRDTLKKVALCADEGCAGERAEAFTANACADINVVFHNFDELTSRRADAVNEQALAIFFRKLTNLVDTVDHAGAGLMENHADEGDLRVFLQSGFDFFKVICIGPSELQTNGGNIVLRQNFIQTTAELAVIQQQRHVVALENRAQAGFVSGRTGTGDDECFIAVVRLKQTVDLFLKTGKHFFEFRASVTNIIVHQCFTDRRFYHNGTRAE